MFLVREKNRWNFFVERFFCRYICPLGAVFAILSYFRLYRIKKPGDNVSTIPASSPMVVGAVAAVAIIGLYYVGTIAAPKLSSHKEYDTVSSEPVVIDGQSLNVDAVNGATFSSNGIIEAVANALNVPFSNPNSENQKNGYGHGHGHGYGKNRNIYRYRKH